MSLVSKEVDLLELFKVSNQSKTVSFVPAFGKHVKADLTTCAQQQKYSTLGIHLRNLGRFHYNFHVIMCMAEVQI